MGPFLRLTAILLLTACCAPRLARAGAVLHAGDLVGVDSFHAPQPDPAVLRLDPATFDTTRIATGGPLLAPDRIAVDAAGIVYVTDHVSGLVAIDAATGASRVLLPLAAFAGRIPHGVCVDPGGGLFVSAARDPDGALLHVTVDPPSATVLAAGGRLSDVGGITLAPDGGLYVAEGTGAVLHVSLAGDQTVLWDQAPLAGPFDVAAGPDGWVWCAQWGGLSRRGGGFVRVKADGSAAEVVAGGDRSQGLATTPAGTIYLVDCVSVSLDCYAGYRHVLRYGDPAGTRYLPIGGLALVPDLTIPARPSTWGALKARYR
jgi:sugar lactone lactonase YvrE